MVEKGTPDGGFSYVGRKKAKDESTAGWTSVTEEGAFSVL